MDINVAIQERNACLALAGRFDFNAHREFRAGVEQLLAQAPCVEVEVNLSDVTYLDSSALGMLLMLRDKASNANKQVYLSGAQGSVRQVLDIANFGKLFRIE